MASKSLAVFAILGSASAASAAIIPSWRVNPITPEAIAASGGFLTSNSISISLMIELTGGSLFNVAGLDLDQFFGPSATPNVRYFHRSGGGASNNDHPTQEDIDNSPGRILAYDTRVATAIQGEPAATPGRLNGTGGAQIGNVGLLPTSGANRVGTNFNVAWGATPNNGGVGTFEIATITFASGVIPGFTPLSGGLGLVADSLNPNTSVPLPPIPLAIPEPASLAIASLGLLVLRRR